MIIRDLPLPGLKILESIRYDDARGYFAERVNRKLCIEHGLPTEYAQDNFSRSNPGVIRGLHFQVEPPQGRLVGVVRGRIWDVVVDARPESPTFGQSHAIELSDMNANALWIPPGFAHGFCVLGDEPADVFSKVDQPFCPESEVGFHWADPTLDIQWPISDPIVSRRDSDLMSFAEYLVDPAAYLGQRRSR